MYIRRTSIKSRHTGEPYYTYRLVESVREGDKVRQKTRLNLGRHFAVPREQWAQLTQRIEQILQGQSALFDSELDPQWETDAQHYAASILSMGAQPEQRSSSPDYQSVDIDRIELLRPRSVGVEHVALSAIQHLGFEEKLTALGFNGYQRQAALGTIIGRMVNPGSELATHHWLEAHSGLGELTGDDFGKLNLQQLYRASDQLYTNKEAIEAFLFEQERTLFDCDEVITLYDLTNTYFEGKAHVNDNAAFGRSKEKRTDCPLVTLALVLDGSGFPKRSEIFPGNACEPNTLSRMIETLNTTGHSSPTIVLDAGIATEANVAWLTEQGYGYVVVSRKRHRQFDETAAQTIKQTHANTIKVQRIVCEDGNEVELYCHSAKREQKDTGIHTLSAQRFEQALEKLAAGLNKKRTIKRYDRVLERIGRLKQKYRRSSLYYEITVEQQGDNASAIHWQRTKELQDTLPGVYCLRTNQTQWGDKTLWQTYTMLTDLEAVFRSLKSELGLRPIYHHKTDRVSGHLFISVLAYHFVHSIRLQLKACNIHLSWEGLRRILAGQQRVTVQLKREDGKTLHIRKTTRAEQRQQVICDALGITANPGRIEKTTID